MFDSLHDLAIPLSTGRALGSVLIVEDDGLIAMTIEDTVREFGARQVHVATNAAIAHRALDEAAIDCAILDILIGNDETYAIADMLAERAVPFLFCSAFTRDQVTERHRHRPMLNKPYRDGDLIAWLASTRTRQPFPA